MINGYIPEYLALLSSQNQQWKGLFVSMQTFIAIEYKECLQSVMIILGDYQRTPNHILQAFFVISGAFEYAMRCAGILPRPKNHGFTQVCAVYLYPPQPASMEITKESKEEG